MAYSSSSSFESVHRANAHKPIPVRQLETTVSRQIHTNFEERKQHRDTRLQWITDPIDGSEKFRVLIDIEGFHPNELSLRTENEYLHIYGERIENRFQGVSKKILQKSYPLPTDIDATKSIVTYPTFTTIQIEYPSRQISTMNRKGNYLITYSQPYLTDSKSYAINESIGYHRRYPTVTVPYETELSYETSSSEENSSDSPIVRRRLPIQSISHVDENSRKQSVSWNDLRSLYPSEFDRDTFYRSTFRPRVLTDRSNQSYIEMKLDVYPYNPEDVDIFVDNTELVVYVPNTSFYKCVNLPSNTDLSTLDFDNFSQNNYIFITANLLDADRFSS